MPIPPTRGGPPPPPPPFPTSMTIPIPITTVTVDTTVIRTTLFTTTNNGRRTSSTFCTASESTGCSDGLPSASSRTGSASLPSIASATSSRTTSSASSPQAAQHTPAAGSAATTSTHSNLTTTQKHAIIGGLSSAIAGLIFIGVLLVLFYRRRQKRKAEVEKGSEKGPQRFISGTWSGVTSDRTAPTPTPPMSRQSSTANVNGNVIRVSLGGFARPFAHHKSWRESMGLSKLMVMNPDDASETPSPGQRGSIESGHSFFQRPYKRSSLSAIVLARSHSRASSHAPTQEHAPPPPVPTISVNPAASSEALAYPAPTPSFSSYPSSPSMRTVQQKPSEDPFLTPPDERLEDAALSPSPRTPRPGLAVLQNAAGSATRTLSNLGQALNPFRSKGNATAGDDDDGTASRQSTLTFSSNGDPFRLDQRSVTDSGSVWMERSPRRAPRVHIPYDRMYEGT